MNLFKQRKTGNLWGYLMHIAGQMGYVITIINLCLLIITTSTLLQTRGINIPVWLMGVLAFMVISTAGIVIYKLGLPSFFGAWNQQWYRHDNPLRKDIEELKEAIARLEKLQEQNEKSDNYILTLG